MKKACNMQAFLFFHILCLKAKLCCKRSPTGVVSWSAYYHPNGYLVVPLIISWLIPATNIPHNRFYAAIQLVRGAGSH